MEKLLFSPIKIGKLEFKNRIFMSPMCQYSSKDGLVSEWHTIHYASRAIGGVGAIIIEATAVEPRGRITPFDLGIYNTKQVDAFYKMIKTIKNCANDVKIGLQLAHAGRKGSRDLPWKGGKPLTPTEGSYKIIAPSPIAFDDTSAIPKEMERDDIEYVHKSFVNAAQNAVSAGFDFLEIHMAHEYLLHEFLSPLSNKRTDEYGGNFQNRIRFPLEIAKAIKNMIADTPVFVRISATDWIEGGWDIKQSIEFVKKLKENGIDLIDVSSGGLLDVPIKADYGFQSKFSKIIKDETKSRVGSVGLIVNPYQAEHILTSEQADVVMLGRALLANPYWPLQAAETMGVEVNWPNRYLRAKNVLRV